MNKKQKENLVKKFNKLFPTNTSWPACIYVEEDDEIRITSEGGELKESGEIVCDYCEGQMLSYCNDFGVNKKVLEFFEKRGMYLEWDNPAYLLAYKD